MEFARDFEVIEYLKNPFTEEELAKLLVKLNKKPWEVVRTQEEYYKQNLKGKHFEEHEWIRILVENPKLIQRPIVEGPYKAVLGDPVSNIALVMK
jgi:arsenate reductase